MTTASGARELADAPWWGGQGNKRTLCLSKYGATIVTFHKRQPWTGDLLAARARPFCRSHFPTPSVFSRCIQFSPDELSGPLSVPRETHSLCSCYAVTG